MYKPFLDGTNRKSDMLSSFGGYVNKTIIPENCFSAQKNMSLRRYPTISTRPKRAFFDSARGFFQGMFSKEKLCYIRDGYLYIGGEKLSEPYFGNSSDERCFVSMGSRLVIFPDKIYVNIKDFSDFGYLEAEFTSSGAECRLCNGSGEVYMGYIASDTEPENGTNGDLWLDTSGENTVLRQFSESMGSWLELSGTRVKILCPGIGTQFKLHDGVTLTGFERAGISGDYVIMGIGDDFITITSAMSSEAFIADEFTVSRRVPDMDFVCESNNRLWGCSTDKNEIYASKLGDPTNFYAFEGISTDSFAVSVGSDGEFTACIPYRGYVLFFKENCVHKIYGQNPPFTVTTSYIRGVERTSAKSLVRLNETLYYKSPTGVCAYEGGVPVDISEDLGECRYTMAVGGAVGNKYYICMSDNEGIRHLFCYDERKAMWSHEDDIDIVAFAENDSNLYFTERKNDYQRIGVIDGEDMYGSFTGELKGFALEDGFDWCFATGLWGLDLPCNKYYESLTIRGRGEKGAVIEVCCITDSADSLYQCETRHLEETGSFNIYVNVPRCDHIKFIFSGKGDITIFSIARDVGVGSDAYV